MPTKADRLLQVLEGIGIPDRLGLIGGIRTRVAGMLVDAARSRASVEGRAILTSLVLEALDLAYDLLPPAPTPGTTPPPNGPAG